MATPNQCRCRIGSESDDKLLSASKVFCGGTLLEAAQSANVFVDSKTFVDMHMKYPAKIVLQAFKDMGEPEDPALVRDFVQRYFDGPNLEFEDWIPTDWTPRPKFLQEISDDALRDWAEQLHRFWRDLGRKVKADVGLNQDRYSLIYVDHPFIVPGGRFREFYYWDSYWIIKGLLVSEMTETVRGMILNFTDMIKIFGFVPNGNRIYYTNRTQPPYLIPSVYEYYKATKDFDFVKNILPDLEKEYMLWMTHRTVVVRKPGCDKAHLLNHYSVNTNKPRPESFREDRETCGFCSAEEAARIYSELASAVETGWDFSTRWLEENETDLAFTKAKEIVPVDLNSLLCLNEKILSDFFTMAGFPDKAEEYLDAHVRRRVAIQEIFWDDAIGAWLDFDLDTGRNRDEFYPSNIMPLWIDSFEEGLEDPEIERKVFKYLKNMGVIDLPGGVPTSLQESGQQWDWPNAWPPLQEMTIQALSACSLPEAKEAAFQLAQNWVTTNFKGYRAMHAMFEKYDVERPGEFGEGGEYTVQIGFGWSNGVILTLMEKYGDRLLPS